MTALAPPISDPSRSLTHQIAASSLPTAVRVAIGAVAAAVLLWPVLWLVPEVLTTGVWSLGLVGTAWLSLWQAALAATLGVALSVPLGWALARLTLPARPLLRALLTLPIVTPALALGLGTAWLLDGGWPLLAAANVGFGLAVGVRLGGAAWSALDPREAEVAETFGLNARDRLRFHYLPALGGAFAAAWALAFALAVSSVGTAHLLGSGSTSALPVAAGSVLAGSGEPAAAALLLAVIVIAALVAFVRCRPRLRASSAEPHTTPLREVELRVQLLLVLVFAAAALVALGPLLALLHGTLTIGAAEQVTGGNVAALFEAARPFEVDTGDALRRSLTLGVAALLLALPSGFIVAVLIAPLHGWIATAIETALFLPLFLSVALGLGLRVAGVDRSLALLFVQLGIAFPLVVRVVLPGARSRINVQFEAATVLGASRWTSWRQLVTPALRRQFLLASVLALVWSWGELGAGLLLYRVDSASASVAVASALQRQTSSGDGQAFALSMLIVLLVTMLFVTIELRRPPEITEF